MKDGTTTDANHTESHRVWEDQLAKFFEAHLDGKEPRLLTGQYVALGEHVASCRHCEAAYLTVSRSWITNPQWVPEDSDPLVPPAS